MSEFTPEEMAKLPKWARGKVQSLLYKLGSAEEEARIVRREALEEGEPFVWVDPYPDPKPVAYARGRHDRQVNIGAGRLSGDAGWQVSVSEDGEQLEVRLPWHMAELHAIPQACNVMLLRAVPR